MNTFLFIHLSDLFLPFLLVLWLAWHSRSVPSPGWRRPRPWSSRRSAGGSTTSSSRWLEASVDPRLHCLKYESSGQQQQKLPCFKGLSKGSIFSHHIAFIKAMRMKKFQWRKYDFLRENLAFLLAVDNGRNMVERVPETLSDGALGARSLPPQEPIRT